MESRVCKVKHNHPETYGDCIAACLRTMTDDDQVPHVFDSRPPEESWGELRAFFASKKKVLSLFPIDDPFEFMEINNPGTTYMLLCSNKDGNHAVVCRDGIITHDPAWYKTEIRGPLQNGLWIAVVIGDKV